MCADNIDQSTVHIKDPVKFGVLDLVFWGVKIDKKRSVCTADVEKGAFGEAVHRRSMYCSAGPFKKLKRRTVIEKRQDA